MDLISLGLILLSTILLYSYYRLNRKDLNLPPFPVRPWPIVGHFFAIKADLRPQFHQWRRKCGDIFSIYIGSKLFVVINDFDLIKETFVKRADDFSDRPLMFIDELLFHQSRGIVWNSGQDWKEQRSVTIAILRKFGFGKNILAERIQEEVSHFLNHLSLSNGQPLDIRHVTSESTANIICSILTGKRFDYNDHLFYKLITEVRFYFQSNKQSGMFDYNPLLKYFPRYKRMLQNVNEILTILKEIIVVSKDGNADENFISSYVAEQETRTDHSKATTMDETNMLRTVFDLCVAGTETTSTTICWFALYMVNHQDVQNKIFAEIKQHVGTKRAPTLEDRPKLVYLSAAIKETQRLASIIPLSVIRACSNDFVIRGYTIPKGSYIAPNLESVLFDEKFWGSDSRVFNPDRFIDEKGLLKKPEEFIPFGVGRRVCLGESMAKLELFLYLSCLVQRFQLVSADPDKSPSLDYDYGLTMIPKKSVLRLVERVSN